MNEVTIGDKMYISAKRAAEITGYARDYVGQLCREGHVDAKMVGRSWYVYEPSIRAHRFGASEEVMEEGNTEEIQEESQVSVPEVKESPVSTWEKPTYTSEQPKMMPEVGSREYQELLPPAEETLTDMQEAWREWFERKQHAQPEPEEIHVEAPVPVIEEAAAEIHVEMAEEETQEVEVPLHRINEEAEEREMEQQEEKIVPIRPVYKVQEPSERAVDHHTSTPPARIVEERIITRPQESKKGKGKSNAPIVALLLGVSFVTIAVTVIGSGFADKYIQTFAPENPIINFLVGAREFKR